jgi:ABC-type nitrate/sulfonate/bicarbonate transport system permease component
MNKRKFRKLLATLVVGSSFIYLTAVTFVSIPKSNMDNAKVIMGFLLGTALATILGFYFGDSDKKDEE